MARDGRGLFLGDGLFPVNVLAAVRAAPEVCRIY
jgi:adenosine/AMP kinase